MKPGILSKSMESERTRVLLIKESTPVVRRASSTARLHGERHKDSPAKESAPIVRRTIDAKMESESTKDSSAKESLPLAGTVNTNSASKEVCSFDCDIHLSTLNPMPNSLEIEKKQPQFWDRFGVG